MTEEQKLIRIDQLRKEKNAVILAHNYQIAPIQDVADYVGDSLGLARMAQKTDKDIIVFCGVYFMAETAKILNPGKTILIPDPDAGCSLVDSITLTDVQKWKAENPGAVTVGYVNSSAEIKSELDYCCTSGNAAQIVASIPAETPILFLPDMFLGMYVKRKTGRKNMQIWAGECHVHAAIDLKKINKAVAAHPGADLMVHPECGCSTTCMLHAAEGDITAPTYIYSTEKMVNHAMASANDDFLIATEVGILHRLKKEAPGKTFFPVSESAVCEYMKMITVDKLIDSLEKEIHPVEVDENIRQKALLSIERMIAVG
ncbi:MAG TPA: quinolinate synthase NadA [Bacteroidetes bacterium]|nr:quinolinate synthase NadA [Bacteroidota bacterium]